MATKMKSRGTGAEVKRRGGVCYLIGLVDINGINDEVACGIGSGRHHVLMEVPRVGGLLDPHAPCKRAIAAPATLNVY